MASEICVSKPNREEAEIIRENYSRSFSLYNGYLLHDDFALQMDSILNMDVKDDDIWVCSFPKAGTTWTQEMVWCIANDLNFAEASTPLPQRYIFLDTCFLMASFKVDGKIGNPSLENKLRDMLSETEEAKQRRNRRFIKTHLPFEFLPRKLRDASTKAKIVYVARNPRDTCISSFHHKRQMGRYKGDLEKYSNLFIKGLVSFGPYWEHVFGYWNEQNNQNLLFIKYEDMKKDLSSVIRKTAKHLEKSVNEDEMDKLCEHLSFGSMKNNPSVNVDSWTEIVKKISNPDANGHFFRKGEVDQWKNDLNPEITEQFERWESENLRKINLEYYSSL